MEQYTWRRRVCEREKFITRQPPIGEKDSENSWISEGLPSSSRRRTRGEGRGEGGGGREKVSVLLCFIKPILGSPGVSSCQQTSKNNLGWPDPHPSP